jgi:hypothetical protein
MMNIKEKAAPSGNGKIIHARTKIANKLLKKSNSAGKIINSLFLWKLGLNITQKIIRNCLTGKMNAVSISFNSIRTSRWLTIFYGDFKQYMSFISNNKLEYD